ncbi:Uncharacterized protein FWK35_00001249 [Aphis craccivora]|uniref:Uncharacterized protein n=1 Tax=Aphis craccivora TaxID=307492 RepID=A0A6G0ZPJ2_APHCR|nr:Uncharacterized protein FWK35_00001249 [Aphis craccivora]
MLHLHNVSREDFLNLFAFILKIIHLIHNNQSVMHKLGLVSLTDMRFEANLICLRKLIEGIIDAPFLFSEKRNLNQRQTQRTLTQSNIIKLYKKLNSADTYKLFMMKYEYRYSYLGVLLKTILRDQQGNYATLILYSYRPYGLIHLLKTNKSNPLTECSIKNASETFEQFSTETEINKLCILHTRASVVK